MDVNKQVKVIEVVAAGVSQGNKDIIVVDGILNGHIKYKRIIYTPNITRQCNTLPVNNTFIAGKQEEATY